MTEDDISKLPGVGDKFLEKLKEAGYDSYMSIAAASASEITSATGIGAETANKIISQARKKMKMGFESATDVLKRREIVGKITTGSKTLDAMLGGGIETQAITEAHGAFGCLTGDTRITLSNGKMLSLGSMAKGLNSGIYPIKMPVLSMSGNSIIKTHATSLHVYDCKSVLKVNLHNGMDICVTPNHPLMTEFGWKEADKISMNDKIKIVSDNNFSKEESPLNTDFFVYKNAANTVIPKLPKTLTSELAELLGFIVGEGWREVSKRKKEERISRVCIVSTNKKIKERFRELVNSVFGIEANLRYKREGKIDAYAIDSVIACEFIKQFNGVYELAKKKHVPSQIFTSPKIVVSKFLATLYDGEGSVKNDIKKKRERKIYWKRKDGTKNYNSYNLPSFGRDIELRSSSRKLVKDVQILLTKFGIKSWISSDITKRDGREFVCFKVHITNRESIEKFYDDIGVYTIRLRDSIENAMESYKRKMKIKANDFINIKLIEKVNTTDGKVYDLEVPKFHNFLADNILSHNSGKSQVGFQLSVNVQLPKEKGGLGGKALFVDSENTFRPERIMEIAKAAGLDPKKSLDNIFTGRAYNSLPANENVYVLNDENFHKREIGDLVENNKGKKILTFSFNPENGKMNCSEVTAFIKHRTPENEYLCKIKTRFGREITVTGSHSLFKGVRIGKRGKETVFEVKGNMRPTVVEASELNVGDHVTIPKNLPMKEKDINEINLSKKLRKVKKISKEIIFEKNIIKLAHTGRMKSPEIPKKIKIDKDILWLLGFAIAEGNSQYKDRLVRTRLFSETKYLEKAHKIIKEKFNINSHLHKKLHTLLISSRLFSLIMVECFGIRIDKTSVKRNVPEWIFQLPCEKIKHFLKGYWDGDGYHGKNRRKNRLIFCTSSRQLANDISMLLLRFEIIGSIIKINVKNRESYKPHWNTPYKIEAAGLSHNNPLDLEEMEQNLNAPSWNDLVFAKIKSIEKTPANEESVYDLEVHSSKAPFENFLGGFGGVCCHNSDHQILLIDNAEEIIKKENIKIIIVDSLTSAFRSDYTGRGTLADRQQKLNRHLHKLQRLADVHNLAIFVTNQVMSRPDILFGDPTAPIGGHIVGHQAMFRIYLRKSKAEKRIAKLIDSPSLPESETVFAVTKEGVRDIKE
ncbi:MAG: hypothetical protein ISS36_03890 [Candidatus Aenigmarchaeota archaeon]|nr:hypothetical protein [Candidatus Aenigmarchaeota archaeon]